MFSVLHVEGKKIRYFLFLLCVFISLNQKVFSQEETSNVALNSSLANEISGNVEYIGFNRFENGEELIMSVEVDNWRLAQVVALKTSNGIQVNFIEFLSALDFPIEQNGVTEYKGWFLNEDNTFELRRKGTNNDLSVFIDSTTYDVSSSQYQLLYSDLYIELSSVAHWFKLNPKVNFAKQIITIDPTNKLPIQLKAQREARRFQKLSNNNESTMPFLDRDYAILSPQAIDIQTNLNYTNSGFTGNYSILGVREILRHNTNLFIGGGTEESIATARLNVSKKSIDADLLGSFNATSYQFGDITSVRVGNLATTRQSRGFRLTNSDLVEASNNQVTNLTGSLLPGWDVELYRNEVLLDQRTNVSNGRYEFNDIALLYGDNQFQLVFYGPQGQIIRKNENKFLSPENLTNRDFNYSLSVTQNNQALFRNSSIDNAVNQSGFNLSGEYSLGFGKTSVIKFGHENIFASDLDSNLISIGVDTSIFDNSLLNYSAAFNDLNEKTFDVSYRTSIGNQSISAIASSRSQLNSTTQDLDTINSVNVLSSGTLLRNKSLNISHQSSFNISRSDSVNVFRVSNNVGTRFGKTYLYHKLDYIHELAAENESIFFGGVGMQRSFGPVFGRFQLGYEDREEGITLSNFSSDLSWAISPTVRTKFVYSKSLITDDYKSSVTVDWKNQLLRISSRITNSKLLGKQLGVSANMSFGGTPESGEFIQSNRGLTNRGTLLVRAFIDTNGNHSYDESEVLLRNVKIKSIQSRGTALTDDEGIATLVGLSSYKPTDIIIDKSSIDDPYLTPIIQGVAVTPREGNIDLIDFPVVNTSELDGNLYLKIGSKTNIAAYVEIGLYKKNKLIQSTLSEFDGFYLFTDIKPGDYTVKITEASMKKLKVVEQPNIVFNFPYEGTTVNGKNITFEQQPQVSKYLVRHGSFPSFRTLKIYWLTHNKKLREDFDGSKITFDQDSVSKKFHLVILKTKQETVARNYCNNLQQNDVDCEVLQIFEPIVASENILSING